MDYSVGLANFVGCSFCPNNYKGIIEPQNSPELSISAADISTCSHGKLNEEKGGEIIFFSLKSAYISLSSHLQIDRKLYNMVINSKKMILSSKGQTLRTRFEEAIAQSCTSVLTQFLIFPVLALLYRLTFGRLICF